MLQCAEIFSSGEQPFLGSEFFNVYKCVVNCQIYANNKLQLGSVFSILTTNYENEVVAATSSTNAFCVPLCVRVHIRLQPLAPVNSSPTDVHLGLDLPNINISHFGPHLPSVFAAKASSPRLID